MGFLDEYMKDAKPSNLITKVEGDVGTIEGKVVIDLEMLRQGRAWSYLAELIVGREYEGRFSFC